MQHGVATAHGVAAQLHVLAPPPLAVGRNAIPLATQKVIMEGHAPVAQVVILDAVIRLTAAQALFVKSEIGVAVALDTVVNPPAALIFIGSPKWKPVRALLVPEAVIAHAILIMAPIRKAELAI